MALALLGPDASERGGLNDDREVSFRQSAGSLNKGGRRAAQSANAQIQVWEDVAASNAKSGATTESDAFTANYLEPKVVAKLAQYQKTLEQAVAGRDRVIGVIVAINGKIEAADIFEATPLFRKLWPKLLKSYALDAADAAEAKEAEKPCTIQDAQAFLDAAKDTKVDKAEDSGGLVITPVQPPALMSIRLKKTWNRSPASRDRAAVSAAQFTPPRSPNSRVVVQSRRSKNFSAASIV